MFFQTAAENCGDIIEGCVKLLDNPSDADGLGKVYIGAHSLRTKSQIMGYSKIEELSGMIEQETKRVLDEERAMTKGLINRIKGKAEEIRELVISN